MKKKPPEPENLERWMVSYADFMTLLFALFVVLYSFAMAKQSEAKSMVESIAQAFETAAVSAPGGALLVPGSLAQQIAQEVQEAVKSVQQSQGDTGKQIIENGGAMMSFQVVPQESSQQQQETDNSSTTSSEEEENGSGNTNSTNSTGELIVSETPPSNVQNTPSSDKPDGGSQSGEGGFQAGGSADHFEDGGQTDVSSDSVGEGTNGAQFDSVRRSISETITDAGMEKYIEIEENPHWLSININSGLLFAEGSASILAAAKPVIQRIAVAMSNINNYVRIRGYTDNSFIPNGIFRNSWDLSANRALSVLNELEKYGIIPERMAIEAYGEYSPKYSNSTAAGRAMNRKVVIAVSRYAIERKPPLDASNIKTDEVNSSVSSSGGSAGSSNIEFRRGDGNTIELNFD